MVEIFKMIHIIDKVNLGKLFCIVEDRRTEQFVKIIRHVNSDIELLSAFKNKVVKLNKLSFK